MQTTAIRILFLAGLLTWVASCTAQTTSSDGKVTISKETTYITAPLRPDGYVDYLEALNRRCSKEITPENNAAVPLWQALGPEPISKEVRTEYFRRLGIEPLPEDGKYSVPFYRYLRRVEKSSKPADLTFDKWEEQEYDNRDQAEKRPWGKKEFPLLAAWLAENRQPLDLAVAGVRRPRYFSPLVGKEGASLLDHELCIALWSSRPAVRALRVRAMLCLHEGKIDEAWQDLLACHRIARLIGQQPSFVDQMAGSVLDSMALQGDIVVAHDPRLTPQQANRFQKQLRALSALPPAADTLDTSDRYCTFDYICCLARGNKEVIKAGGFLREKTWVERLEMLITDPRVDWNEVLRISNRNQDERVIAFRKTTFAERQKALAKMDKESEALAKKVSNLESLKRAIAENGDPKSLARLLVALLSEPGIPYRNLCPDDQVATHSELGQLAFALAAYRHEHKQYPKSLKELAPKYIAAIPKDRFSGEDLRYKRRGDGYVLYSIGPNEKDDDGRGLREQLSRDHEGDMWDDIVIRTPGP